MRHPLRSPRAGRLDACPGCGGGRDDECPEPRICRELCEPLRPRQRRTLPGTHGCDLDRDSESGRRRGHDGPPRAPTAAGGTAHEGRARLVRGEHRLNVAVLSGGVGGARFVSGVVDVAGSQATTVIGNVGDDVEVLGLHVSPDLDSILYALAGLSDERRGWGRSDETWQALETVGVLGGEDWFALGDLDLGLHLVRTQALRAGEPLSAVTARLTEALGVET